MKKTYSKPDIAFEDFSLSTNIAAGCEEVPFGSTGDCGVKWGKKVIFTESITGCTSKIVEGDTSADNLVDQNNNGLCYHNPFDSYNVLYS